MNVIRPMTYISNDRMHTSEKKPRAFPCLARQVMILVRQLSCLAIWKFWREEVISHLCRRNG